MHSQGEMNLHILSMVEGFFFSAHTIQWRNKKNALFIGQKCFISGMLIYSNTVSRTSNIPVLWYSKIAVKFLYFFFSVNNPFATVK